VHILHPQLALHKITIGIYQTGFAQTDGLYLGSREHDTCRVRIDKFIIERCTLILYINEKGLAKLVVALAKGKKQYDKRESLKEKDDRREMDRMFKR
jgi:tmRNA-binding protein